MIWRDCFKVFSLLLFVFTALTAEATPPSSKLGTVDFPTSGSGEAQQHFLQGVAALHSFWYPEALEAFQKATQSQPDFAMGYWGQAMAHNHPLWEGQDTAAGRAALAQIGDTSTLTPRERAYLDAVQLLYSAGEKPARDLAYSNAMENIYRSYPEDAEAACFYSLSLLGVARNSPHKLGLQVRSGAIAMEVFRRNPDHPCAAHYTIHAFDDPDLAILALPSARRYAQIAPAAHHALHMPAHIFVQLGMWPETAASNEEAWNSSMDWVSRKGLPLEKRSYHTLQWLQYAYLQQGRYSKADAVLETKVTDMKSVFQNPDSEAKAKQKISKYYEEIVGASIIETERWEKASTLNLSPEEWNPDSYDQALLAFVRGFAAARQGSAEAEGFLAELNGIREKGISENYFNRPETLDIWALEIQAALRLHQKEYAEAISLMHRARALEEALPAPSGPPRLIKPTHEFLGEILLAAGQPEKAAGQFATALMRQPNRARSLLGAARAAAAIGDASGAAEGYRRLLAIWGQADPDLPGRQEAKTFLK